MKHIVRNIIIVLVVLVIIVGAIFAGIHFKQNEWKKTDEAVDTTVDETALPDYTNGNICEIYLDKSVNENGTGTKTAPFNNFDDALNNIEKIQQSPQDYDAIRLNINGLYEVDNTISFESKHTANIPLIVKGENDATISGGYSFKGGWTEYKDGIYQYPIKVDAFRTLFVDGQGQQRSRFPNKTENPEKCVLLGKWDDEGRKIGVDKKITTVLPEDTNSVCDHLEVFIAESWTQAIAKCDSASVDKKYVNFSFPEHLEKGFFEEPRGSKKAEPYVWIENDLSLLDEESEWYYDVENAVLYYKPKAGTDINSLTFTVPKVETLMSIKGTKEDKVDKIFFEDLTFAYSNWNYPSYNGMVERQATNFYNTKQQSGEEKFLMPSSGIYIDDADNITFYNNKIINMGASGIAVYGASNDLLMKCNTLKNIGGSAAIIGCFERDLENAEGKEDNPYIKENLATGITVEDNYIAHVGELYMGGIGVQIGLASDVNVQHNELHDITYSGMSVGWGWTSEPTPRDNIQVCNNKIYDTMNNLIFDGAGVYFLGQFEKESTQNKFIGNYIECGNGYSGFYFDEGSQNFLATNNVVKGEGLVGWLLIHDIEYLARDLDITHNYTTTKDYHINSWSRDKDKKKIKPEDRNVNITDTRVKNIKDEWSVGAQSIIDNAGIREQYINSVKG